MKRIAAFLVSTALLLGLLTTGALGHAERESFFPAGESGTPSHRDEGPALVVCKPDTADRLAHLPAELRTRNEGLLQDCAFEHIQEAVDAVTEQNSRILVMPGIYREEPSIEARNNPSGACAELADREGDGSEDGGEEQGGIGGELGGQEGVGAPVYSYEEQAQCRHVQNLIAVFGDDDGDGTCDNARCNLQMEGTGAAPTDVVIDGDFGHLNGIRADRADGFYLHNLTVQRFEFNAVYVLETDGFGFDDVLTRWNDEYGFLSFAVDHGLYQNCESYGNGDSGIYPGSASDINSDRGYIEDIREEIRFATEIRGCRSHHSTLGYSGTAGNSVWSHHNEFDNNATGMAMDSLFPDHPGLPQDHAMIEHNLIHSNNFNPYLRDVQTGRCTGEFKDRGYDDGVVCPVVPVRVGSGIMIAGGNHNLIEDNTFYDNHEQGIWQFFVPAVFRGEDDPALQFDTSNDNTHRGNTFAVNPNGDLTQPSGLADLHWDGEGAGNCWEANVGPDGAAATAAIAEFPAALPSCESRPPFTPGPGVAVHASCSEYDRDDEPSPPGCTWFEQPDVPASRQGGPGGGPVLERVSGQDRVATAVAASREARDRADIVVIARSDLHVDALVAGALAAKVEGSLLVNPPSRTLAAANAAEIQRLGARQALVIGGPNALPAELDDALAEVGITDVARIAGEDRYDTAARIAPLVGGAHLFVTRGDDPTDTTAVAYLSAKLGRPIMPVPPEGLAAANRRMLATGSYTDAKIVGGEAALPADLERELGTFLEDLERLAGDDRYATSLEVARYAVATGSDPTELWFTTGTNWVDGIGAAPAVAADEGVLLLTDGDVDAPSTTAWLDEHRAIIERVRVLGGPVAVDEALLDGLREELGAVDGDAVGDRTGATTVTTGRFVPHDDAPATYQDATGTARMTRTHLGTTRVELTVQGLPRTTRHPVHVHTGTCAVDKAGPHFQYEIGGSMMPPNEIHPTFVTDGVGVGVGDTTSFRVADETARSINIHTPAGDKVLCADLR